ncbi:hypothetical protein [Kribbella sp. NPDC051620]|uniref:hypothetical protein n=1 Tax=Kribbella sp. NPDC051620 TaxID=3364120 RepID=UPI0037AFA4CA
MVTDATKKLREPVAYILLAFAGLVALALLIRLFVGSAGFTNAAAVVQGQVTPPTLQPLVLLVALAASVWLVNEAGERTPNARTVTLAALSITGLLVLIGLIVAFASFGETSTAGLKISSFIFALGGLALYGVVGLYILKTFQSLPAPVRVPKAASQGQFAGQQGQYGAPGQYPQQGGQYGTQQGQYGQYGAPQGQYGQNEQYGAYGAGAAGAAAGAAGGYAAAQGGEQQWPQEQSWNQGEQQQTWPVSDAEAQPHAESPAAQPVEQAWSAEGHAAEPTQQWSPEGQQQWGGQEQGQQWPQEQQQWGGADSGQQWGTPGQEQYGQPAQQEWPAQEAAQPEQQHQTWPQEGQAWQAEAAPAAEQPAEAAVPEGADETRVETPVSDAPKDQEAQQQQDQQGQGGQQGWWSQPS